MDTPPSHPTPQTLSAYGLGKLDAEAAEAVDAHVRQCADCRNRVAEVSADSFLDRVRGVPKPSGSSQTGGTRSVFRPLPPSRRRHPPARPGRPPGLPIKKELGRGGMGVVYLAHNTLMGRDEVLKVMGRQIIDRPGVLDRFLREIRAVARLRHPNIVTAYSAFRLGENIVFAMEYVEGLDLVEAGQGEGAAAGRPRLPLRSPGGPRAAARPRGGAGPPRHQAGQPDALPQGGQGDRQGARLRPGQGRPARRRSTAA